MSDVLQSGTRVTVRCDRCARDLGAAAPAMAACVRDPNWNPSGWMVDRLLRARPFKDVKHPEKGREERQTLGNIEIDGRGVELSCRRCHRRPRISYRRLYELVEQAVESGRRDAYL